MIAHSRKKPGDYQDEVFIALDIDEIAQPFQCCLREPAAGGLACP